VDRRTGNLLELLRAARARLARLQAPELARFLDDGPRWACAAAPPRRPAARPLPVLRFLADAMARSRVLDQRLAAALTRAMPDLLWRQTYSKTQVDPRFLANYGWTEFLGPHAPVRCARLSCGLLLLGPGIHYPGHRHPAEEIYVPLAGTAEWQRGREPWTVRLPGAAILHESGEIHAMRTGTEPLLALYLWRGGGLDRSARLVPAVAAEHGRGLIEPMRLCQGGAAIVGT
jgi:mannose-6-phosphate isomerase-like protein (cupin superfamily)